MSLCSSLVRFSGMYCIEATTKTQQDLLKTVVYILQQEAKKQKLSLYVDDTTIPLDNPEGFSRIDVYTTEKDVAKGKMITKVYQEQKQFDKRCSQKRQALEATKMAFMKQQYEKERSIAETNPTLNENHFKQWMEGHGSFANNLWNGHIEAELRRFKETHAPKINTTDIVFDLRVRAGVYDHLNPEELEFVNTFNRISQALLHPVFKVHQALTSDKYTFNLETGKIKKTFKFYVNKLI